MPRYLTRKGIIVLVCSSGLGGGAFKDYKVVRREQEPIALERISVFGLGGVGLIMAVALAKHGYEVAGVVVNPTLVQDFLLGRLHSMSQTCRPTCP